MYGLFFRIISTLGEGESQWKALGHFPVIEPFPDWDTFLEQKALFVFYAKWGSRT